jgi:hypothetical protein
MATAFEKLTTAIPPALNLANIKGAPAESLCEVCETALLFLEEGFRKPSSYRYMEEPERNDSYPNFPGLKASAKACGLCRLMRKTIRESWADVALEHSFGLVKEGDSRSALLKRSWSGEVLISIAAGFGQLPGGPEDETTLNTVPRTTVVDRIEVRVVPVFQAPRWKHVKQREKCWKVFPFKIVPSPALKAIYPSLCRNLPSQETLSAENVALIRSWLDGCREYHNRCQPEGQDKPGLPTRLLDLGSIRGQLPRVIETRDLQGERLAELSYVALSHMWGDPNVSEPPTQTVKANLADRLKGVSNLSRNFIEAAKLCRRLGQRYIWIDSLCIVQDDAEDWRREAATMHSVYRMASFTLVLTGSTSPQDGFLRRTVSHVPAIKIHHRFWPDSACTFVLAPISKQLGSGVWDGDVEQSRWNMRGWTMQERSLSLRSLHIACNQIYFECRTGILSEENGCKRAGKWSSWTLWPQPPPRLQGGIESLGVLLNQPLQDLKEDLADFETFGLKLDQTWAEPEHPLRFRAGTATPLAELGTLRRMAEGHRQEWRSYWGRVVEQYSRRQLTRGSDKLVAIESIASDVIAQTGDRYDLWSGVWRHDAPVGLTWCVEQGMPRRNLQSQVPSWSWASLDGQIGWNKVSFSSNRLLPAFATQETLKVGRRVQFRRPDRPITLVIDAWCRHISAIRSVQRERPASFRGRWALSGPKGDSESPKSAEAEYAEPFALGDLDFSNRDGVLNLLEDSESRPRFLYLHLLNTHRHTGLILLEIDEIDKSVKKLGRSLYGSRVYQRIGVASIYGYDDQLMGAGDGKDWKWGTRLYLV